MIRFARYATRLAQAATLLWLGLAVALAITGRWWQAAAAAGITLAIDIGSHHMQRRLHRLQAIADRLDQLRDAELARLAQQPDTTARHDHGTRP